MGGFAFFAVVMVAVSPAPDAEPTPVETSRVQLTAETDVAVEHSIDAPQFRTVSTDVTVAASVYVRRPLVDDDAPLSLQPFLQRASVVYLSTTGGASTPAEPEPYTFRSHREGAAAGFDLYLTSFVALTASLGVWSQSGPVNETNGSLGPLTNWLALPVTLGVGLRLDDVRFDLRYRVVPLRDGDDYTGARWIRPYFGNVSLFAYLVHQRRLSVDVEIDAIQSGAIASAELHHYFNRRLAFFIGAWGGRGVVYINSFFVQSRAGGVLGLTGWFSRHLGLSVSYSPNWTSAPQIVVAGPLNNPTDVGPDTMTHTFSFELLTRAK